MSILPMAAPTSTRCRSSTPRRAGSPASTSPTSRLRSRSRSTARLTGRWPATARRVSSAPGRWTISQPRPVATYMTTLVAGPYHSVRASHDGIPLVLHARASLAEFLDRDAAALFEHTGHCFDELHRLFGMRYPWGEYHQAFVPDFNAGAMENPGLRDVPRPDDLPVADHRCRAGAAQQHHRARDGTHVVRRHRDHAVVGRPVAERVVRRVPRAPGLRHARRAGRVGAVRRLAQGLGICGRPPTVHPSGCRATARSTRPVRSTTSTGSPTRRAPRPCASSPARLGDEVFLGGLRDYIADLRVRQRGAGRSAGRVDRRRRAATLLTGPTSGCGPPAWTPCASTAPRLLRTAPPEHPAQREHAITVAAYPSGERAPLLITSDVTDLPLAGDGSCCPARVTRRGPRSRCRTATWTATGGAAARAGPDRARGRLERAAAGGGRRRGRPGARPSAIVARRGTDRDQRHPARRHARLGGRPDVLGLPARTARRRASVRPPTRHSRWPWRAADGSWPRCAA